MAGSSMPQFLSVALMSLLEYLPHVPVNDASSFPGYLICIVTPKKLISLTANLLNPTTERHAIILLILI